MNYTIPRCDREVFRNSVFDKGGTHQHEDNILDTNVRACVRAGVGDGEKSLLGVSSSLLLESPPQLEAVSL